MSTPAAAAGREAHLDGPTAATSEPQLRFALAMNGGVSLAVWIGGVCDELLRLCVAGRKVTEEGSLYATAPTGEQSAGWGVYETVCWAAGLRPRVDVLAGASAGGLNGVILALGLIYDKEDLRELRDLWLEAGSFSDLLRDPLEPAPQSLMRGDEHFLVKIEEAIRRLTTGDPRPAEQVPIDLTLTATSLGGRTKSHPNDFGDAIVEKEHAVNLKFRHTAGGRISRHRYRSAARPTPRPLIEW